jgi:hypothetical protein
MQDNAIVDYTKLDFKLLALCYTLPRLNTCSVQVAGNMYATEEFVENHNSIFFGGRKSVRRFILPLFLLYLGIEDPFKISSITYVQRILVYTSDLPLTLMGEVQMHLI